LLRSRVLFFMSIFGIWSIVCGKQGRPRVPNEKN
jgi:hypothetical protein